MMRLLLMIVSITFSFSQVRPYAEPYGLKYNSLELNENIISVDGEIFINYMQEAAASALPSGVLYRLTLTFDGFKKGFLSIQDWHVPEGSSLFIFNSLDSYTGPYLSKDGDSFFSGRFASDRLILEYFEPINAAFNGNFIINKLEEDFTVLNSNDSEKKYFIKGANRDRPTIMVTGYWPPTNEMVRHFSQSDNLNPEGWQGENWEGLGYDVVSYFPEFNPADCNNCGQGFGDLEVDYQDYSQDFWPIIEEVRPVGIITFSRGFNDLSWELENRLVNRTNWYDDYTAPFLPTPNPPDDSVSSYHVRYNSLPISDIIRAIDVADLGLDPYLDDTNAGLYLSEFSGYHGVWYKESFESNNEFPCFASGHIHVGAQVDWGTAKEAAEISIRTLIEYVDQLVVIAGDCNGDGEVNVLDVVMLSSVILDGIELTESQMLASDLDSNGILNVLDIIAIINLILS